MTICFKPDFSATEACSTAGAVPVPFNDPGVGTFTQDKVGNFCGTATDVASVPGDVHPPIVTTNNVSGKLNGYDPATGSGDWTITTYAGGKCNGAIFDNAGATANGTVTVHAVASNNGNHVDFVFTSLTDQVGDVGAFNFIGVNLKQ